MNLPLGSVNNMASRIYEKLYIHSRRELSALLLKKTLKPGLKIHINVPALSAMIGFQTIMADNFA